MIAYIFGNLEGIMKESIIIETYGVGYLIKVPQSVIKKLPGLHEKVKVYTMGDVSKEICGGPHAKNTGDLVNFKIKKEESSSAGVRRIKATINN